MTDDRIFETERLIVRPWRSSDREPFAALNSDTEVMRHFPAPLPPEESDALVDNLIGRQQRFGFTFSPIEEKTSGAFLGFVGLSRHAFESPVRGETEIGWRLARRAWGKGYASEAAIAWLRWFWPRYDEPRVVSITTTTNLPSQAVMRRIGMSHRQELDFDHPNVPDDSVLKRHVTFAIDRPEGA